jgi:protein-disulfide isomerase-like protein with CxxC motif
MEPSIAVQICKQEKPESIFEFMSALHKDIYVHGLKTAVPGDYGRLAKTIGFEEKKFINNIQSEEYRQLAEKDFQEAMAMNIDGYPAVLIRVKGGLRVIARGYVDWEQFSAILSTELQQ